LRIRDEKQIPIPYALRLGWRGQGCAGNYLLGFDKPNAKDELFEYEGLKICIDKAHFIYLSGALLKFQNESEKETGFVFL
jgi:iron-sulfur cluster assembly protein